MTSNITEKCVQVCKFCSENATAQQHNCTSQLSLPSDCITDDTLSDGDPYSNTGSQTSKDEKNPNNGTGRVVAKLDWVQGIASLPETQYRRFVETIKETFLIDFSDDLGSRAVGRVFQHHHKADGALIAYNVVEVPVDFADRHKDSESVQVKHRYDVLFSITGRGLANCHNPSQQHWQFLNYLAAIGSRVTRLDIALDDFSKQHHPTVFVDATESGKATGYKKYVITGGRKWSPSKGWIDDGCTLYLGSRQSDKVYRYYDKSLESKGITDSYRLEGEYKDEYARSVFENLIQSASPEKYYQSLIDVVCGGIDYREKAGNQDGEAIVDEFGHILTVRCAFWQDLIDRSKASPFKVLCGRVRSSIEQSIQWVERAVTRTLATIEQFMDCAENDFHNWLKNAITESRSKIKSEHIAQINSGLMQLSALNFHNPELTEKEVLQGIF